MVRQSDCLRVWGRDLGSCARGKKKGITYTLAVTSIYQKLNNLPHGLGEHSPRYFTALGAGILACGSACRFLWWKHYASASPCVCTAITHSAFQVCSVRVPIVCLVPPSLCATSTQLALPFNSDLFLFGLCSLQQIGYALAKQFGRSAASVTFSCPHTRSYHSRGRLKSFLRWLW